MFNLLDFNDDGYSKYETIASELKYVQDISQNNILESKIGFLQNNYQFNSYFYKLEPNNPGLYNPHFNLDFAQRDKYLSFPEFLNFFIIESRIPNSWYLQRL